MKKYTYNKFYMYIYLIITTTTITVLKSLPPIWHAYGLIGLFAIILIGTVSIGHYRMLKRNKAMESLKLEGYNDKESEGHENVYCDSLVIQNGHVICPRCDGNGFIYKARIQELDLIVYICDECEAMWNDVEELKENKFIDLSTFLKSKGFYYADVGIADLGYDWLNDEQNLYR